MKKDVEPFHQKLRKIYPTLEPLVQNELKKILNSKIIFQFLHFSWVSNFVYVRKKIGGILLCVDF